MIRQYGAQNLVREFVGHRGGSALLTLFFFIILVMEFGAMGMLTVEKRSPNANIKNASDALWYMYVTITTVGYGDRYPVTNAGRLIGVVVLTLGVGLFGTLTGFLANAFLAPQAEGAEAKDENPAEKAEESESRAEAMQQTGQPLPNEVAVVSRPGHMQDQASLVAAILQLFQEEGAVEVRVRKTIREIEK
jgi:voltage-gated potassium channel